MNDLTELRELGRDLDADLPQPSAALRRRVLASFDPEPTGRGWRSWTVRRPVIAVGLTAAVAIGILVSPISGLWGGTSGASAEAAQVLDRAARAALREPALSPRPRQFVFVESLEAAAGILLRKSGKPEVQIDRNLREIWLSVNGTRNGLLREQPRSGTAPGHPTGPWRYIGLPGCKAGRQNALSSGPTPGNSTPVPVGWSGGDCHPVPAAPRGLPTTAAGMFSYLYNHLDGQNPPDQQAFITAGDLIRENYIPPAALAAVFRATAQISGVTLVDGAVTANGRRGIAVQRIFNGVSDQLIFDPTTYAFIGEREVVVSAGSGLKLGTVLDSTSVLRIAIVDRVGQLPSGRK